MDFWVGDQLCYKGGTNHRTGEEINYTVTIEDITEDAVLVRHAPPHDNIVFWWGFHSPIEGIFTCNLIREIENGEVIVKSLRNRIPDWEI